MHPSMVHPVTADPASASAPNIPEFMRAPASTAQPPMPPPQESALASSPTSDEPIAVVRVLSTRGVEYGMMTIALWVTASTMAWILLNMLNGSRGFDSVVVPTAALVVCLPVFGLFFLRLKKAELMQPRLRLDPSKRRWSQTSQFLAYLALLINFIYFVYTVLQHFSGSKGQAITKALINLVIILVIAGGVLAYYWHDEHKARA
jgi:hypothetical protein